MAENVGNKWSGLLNGAIDNDDTSVAYDNSVGTLPAVNFRAVIQDAEDDDTNREIVLVTAGTSSPLTVTRAQEGTSGVSHGDNSYIVHVLTAGGLKAVMGGIIGSVAVTTGSDGTAIGGGGTSSTSLVDVDATNLKVDFTVPASGKVLVRLNGMLQKSTSGLSRWGIRESTTNIAVGVVGSSTNTDYRPFITFLITGLTPGDAKTYKWAFSTSAGTTFIVAGPTYGAAVMTIEAVP